MKLRAVILDWAGTTVDFGCLAPVVVLEEIFARAGVPLKREEARHAMGTPKKDQIRAISRLPRVAEAWRAAHGASPVERDVEELYASFIPAQIDCIERHSSVIRGVPEAVAQMRARGLSIGSTTGYTREMLDRILPVAAVGGYAPDFTITPDEAGGGRPAPWMCFELMRRMNVYPPRACVKIGDTAVDIEEGRNAGMWTIGITATGNEVGLTEAEFNAIPASERARRTAQAEMVLLEAGADFIAASVLDAVRYLDEIDQRV
jgi:phosphonoacetaldehyde hydrolase